jgi:hypothetical protein
LPDMLDPYFSSLAAALWFSRSYVFVWVAKTYQLEISGQWMFDGRQIMHLGQIYQESLCSGELMGQPPDIRKRSGLRTPVHVIPTQTPSIHVIWTLTDYIDWFLCVFGFLDWFWNGKTSNNILFLFMFYCGQPFKKVPNKSWIRPQDWWECTQDPSNLKPFDKCHASGPLGSPKDVFGLSYDHNQWVSFTRMSHQ